MTDAPKRIWIDEHYWWGERQIWNRQTWGTEYGRADLSKKLQSAHRALLRAAFNLCLSLKSPHPDIKAILPDLWALCKDYDPTEE